MQPLKKNRIKKNSNPSQHNGKFKPLSPRRIIALIGLIFVFLFWLAIKYLPPFPDQWPDVYKDKNFIESLIYPVEENGEWRMPYIPGGFYSITHTPGTDILFAVGGQGRIYKSIDNGKSWILIESGIKKTLMEIIFVNSENGFIVGENGTILKTIDGGKKWVKKNTLLTDWLESVMFINDTTGFVVGGNGTILKTTDNGETWVKMKSGTDSRLLSVAFISTQIGFISGNSSTILKTTDGGETWIKIETGIKNHWLNSITFITNKIGFVVGTHGTILKTIDSGETWIKKESNILNKIEIDIFDNYIELMTDDNDKNFILNLYRKDKYDQNYVLKSFVSKAEEEKIFTIFNDILDSQGWLRSIIFINDTTGFTVGNDGTILKTIDSGDTWIKKESNTNYWLRSTTCLNSKVSFAAGFDGTILKTIDHGETWHPITFGSYYKINYITEKHGLLITDEIFLYGIKYRTHLLSTTNSGKNWQKYNSLDNVKSISFVNNTTGYAIDYNDDIYRTTDIGVGWEKISKMQLTNICFIDEINGFGESFKSLYTTNDGAKTWNRIGGIEDYIYAMVFIDTKTGYYLTTGNSVFKTIDGGKTWIQKLLISKGSLSYLTFSDSTTGFVTSTTDLVYKTTDAGETWTETQFFVKDKPITEYITSIQFLKSNPSLGWVLTEPGNIYKTKDKGETWTNDTPLYTKSPAPISYVILIIAILLFIIAAFKKPKPYIIKESVEDILATDKPIENSDKDLLDFKKVSSAIARFIMNKKTEPPLTIAVTGEWGSGKSSIMNMTDAQLKRAKFSTVHFNGWHHQNEEHLLAALLENIKLQALPPLFSTRWVLFYVKLFLLRTKRSLPLYGLVTFIFFFLYYFLDAIPGFKDHFTEIFSSKSLYDFVSWFTVIRPLLLIIYAGLLLFKFLQSFSPFGAVDSLFKRLKAKLTIADIQMDTGFRYKFAREFKEVTNALKPKPLVIFIDDLDRCSPATVLTILESINFLVSSGDCFIILGMDINLVKGYAAVAFEQEGVFKYLKDQEKVITPEEFGKNYMEKLINIQVSVPIPGKYQYENIISSIKDKKSIKWPESKEEIFSIKVIWKAILLQIAKHRETIHFTWDNIKKMIAVVFLFYAGWSLILSGQYFAQFITIEKPETAGLIKPAASSLPDKTALVAQPSSVPEKPVQINIQETTRTSAYSNGQLDQSKDENLYQFLILVLFLFLIIILIDKIDSEEMKDSDIFQTALKAWSPLISAKYKTPRAIKRFQNKVRFLAMYNRDLEPDNWIDKELSKLDESSGQKETPYRLCDDNLVTLSILHDYDARTIKEVDSYKSIAGAIQTGDIQPILYSAWHDKEKKEIFKEHNELLIESIESLHKSRKEKPEQDSSNDQGDIQRELFLNIMKQLGQ